MNKTILTSLKISCLLSIVLLVGPKVSVKGNPELPVHNIDTGLNYATIQEAIDAPETLNEHTIFVKSGIYYEHVVIDKSLMLLGENRNTTIIDGNHTGEVIFVTFTHHVTIVGLTIQNSGSGGFETGQNDSGIRIFSSDNCNITENIITNCLNGIMSASSDSLISRNVLVHNKRGIYALDCFNSTIAENVATDNELGMSLLNCHNSTIYGNDLNNNEVGIEMHYSNHNVVYHNNFIGNNTQVKISFSQGNKWDNNLEGNYWSDYEQKYPNATEIDNSGIWNTPYVIDTNNQDNYPIVPEFPSLIILPLFMITTLLTAIIHKRKHLTVMGSS